MAEGRGENANPCLGERRTAERKKVAAKAQPSFGACGPSRRWGGLRQGSDHRPWEKPAAAIGALALSPCTSGEQGDGVGSAAPWSQAGR